MMACESEARGSKSVQREVVEAEGEARCQDWGTGEMTRLGNRRWMSVVGGYSPNTELVGCSQIVVHDKGV